MQKLYKIKPLEWVEVGNGYTWYTVRTILGSIDIEHDGDVWLWRYCFDEYYDEDKFYCNTKEECFQNAEKFYLERLTQALEIIE